MEKEKQLLIKCRLLIEQLLNWGDSSIWTNDDFEQLSEKIFEKTKVQLSVSTLKRIWGKVRYENFPTHGTLNALSGFLGYESWRDFRQKNESPDVLAGTMKTSTTVLPESTVAGNVHKPTAWKIYLPVLLIILALSILGVKYVSGIKSTGPIDLSTVKFEAVKVTDTLPNSVVFNYDATAFKSDSVYIQQSWDPRRREKVAGNGKQYTSIYYNPGYFLAKLVVDNKIRKEYVVSIKTKGWKGIIERNPIPIYLSPKEIKRKGFMGISDSLFREKIGIPVFNDTWVKFANVKEYEGIDAGNFTLETTFRNTSAVEASVCRGAYVLLLGQGSAISIPFSDKGCISGLNLLAGYTFISGKDHDMSAFGCDFSKFQNLKCTVANRQLMIYLNNKLTITVPQKKTLGKIEGIRFEFEGSGQVKNVKLSTPGGGVYDEKF